MKPLHRPTVDVDPELRVVAKPSPGFEPHREAASHANSADVHASVASLDAVPPTVKSFDPASSDETARVNQRSQALAIAIHRFGRRLRADATLLAAFRKQLALDPESSLLLQDAQSCAHKLAGVAGIFGYQDVSCAAAALEEGIIARRAGTRTPADVETDLDALIGCIGTM